MSNGVEDIPKIGRDERACPTLSPHQIVRIAKFVKNVFLSRQTTTFSLVNFS